MIEHEFSFRVLYPDTDKMGTVHHSNYAKYYETARWELFRSIGISYRSVEEAGYLLPVTSIKMKYYKTTFYDERLTIQTTLKDLQGGVLLYFTYKIFNEQNILINEGETELAFVSNSNWQLCDAPDFVVKAIEKNKEVYF
jgi:acyl-CoA thioester hydrolase